jgi:hypothetical protein
MGGALGTGDSGGPLGYGGTAPVCNQLAEDAPTYGLTADPGAAPTPLGGIVVDGTYVLNRQTIYGMTLPATEMGRVKVEITGSTWQQAEAILPYDVNPDRHTTSTFSVQGTSLTMTRTCPSAGQPEISAYTADASSLTLFVVDHGMTAESVFTRR